MNIKYYKRYIEKLIDASPANISFTRKEHHDDGFGGVTETETEIEPQKVRFYNKSLIRETLLDKGKISGNSSNSTLKMLAKSGANIKVDDIFVYGVRTYRVAFLGEYEGICFQAEMEVVS